MYDIFEKQESMKTKAYRPSTSNAFRVPFNLSDPIGSSHYDLTYYEKEIDRRPPIRTGTASGTRANNPHPSKEFMVFRFRPLKKSLHDSSDWSQPIGDKLLSQVIKNQMKSVYASDYVNNVEEKAKFEEEAKHAQRLSSAARANANKRQKDDELRNSMPTYQYNNPFTYESLNLSPNRYGSSIHHRRVATGILPNIPRN